MSNDINVYISSSIHSADESIRKLYKPMKSEESPDDWDQGTSL